MPQVEEKPDVTYSDVGGCKEQIEKLREVGYPIFLSSSPPLLLLSSPPSQVPFSQETRDQVMDKLSDMNFVQDVCDDLHSLFEVSRPTLILSRQQFSQRPFLSEEKPNF